MSEAPARTTSRYLTGIAAFLGTFSWGTVLAFHNIADGDLWAKLTLGAFFWNRGEVLKEDRFAFTPVLSEYIDHEWGAGAIFYGALKLFGPVSLLWLKILLAFGALTMGLILGRRSGCRWPVLLFFAIPCALAIAPGYGPVIRSHTFTYFFFAVTLLCLEQIRNGRTSVGWVVVLLMIVWANVHGGFVAGLGAVTIYALSSIIQRSAIKPMLLVCAGSWCATFLNPYGIRFWHYLVLALLHRRPDIQEWSPLPVFSIDPFIGFRVLFVLTLLVLAAGWKRVDKGSWAGPILLAVTAYLGWRSRRHGPFFGVSSLAFAAPYVESALFRFRDRIPANLRAHLSPPVLIVACHGVLALWVATRFLPDTTFQVLAPVRQFPVREVDILERGAAKGNLAVPFSWGSYATWRLYPHIKVSIDGRYEAAYPESTFQMNIDFFFKQGTNWDRLIRDYPVDFIILYSREGTLQPSDLAARGYTLIWHDAAVTALLAKDKYAAELRKVADELPPSTVEPLDPKIPLAW